MERALTQTSIEGLDVVARGKVREIYGEGDRLILIASDRVSAFDIILNQGVPGRGRVLTRISAFWFDRLQSICPHHMISTDLAEMPAAIRDQGEALAERTMLVKRLEMVPVECVVRGYLAGSGWKEYQQSQSVCGVALPPGLRNSDRLPEPIFTPTTKSEEHDEPMTFAEVEAAVGPERAAALRDTSLALYEAGAAHAAERGIILADTKFEFGAEDDHLVLADEALTPDSSRYWSAADYEPGRNQDSFDKQQIRDWLESSGWDKKPPAPDLPDELIAKVVARYEEIERRLTS